MISSPLTSPEYSSLLPTSFAHGFATAAYQIEGGRSSRGTANWDIFLQGQNEDGVTERDNGDITADSYNHWKEDVELLKSYGVNAYRFSVAWSRVIPLGGKDDPVSEEGIKYYSDLIDALLEANITPYITLYHFDLPQSLEERYGGFLASKESDILEDFTNMAKLLFERFGDRVKHWITINEPHIHTLGTSMLRKPFDLRRDPWIIGRRLILSHAHAVDLYRREYQPKQGGQIGITLNCDWVEPLDESPEAKKCAQIGLDVSLGWFADPIYLGKSNPYLLSVLGSRFPDFTEEEFKLIKGSSDFFGLNTYGTLYATGEQEEFVDFEEGVLGWDLLGGRIKKTSTGPDGKEIGVKGEMGHPYIAPWGFRKLINYLNAKYLKPNSIPLLITENGFPVDGESKMSKEEVINDTHRQEYYAGYIKELVDAMKDDGLKCSGYFGWSLMDNLEWIFGFKIRFGVTYIDKENGFKRVPKDSSRLIKSIFDNVMQK